MPVTAHFCVFGRVKFFENMYCQSNNHNVGKNAEYGIYVPECQQIDAHFPLINSSQKNATDWHEHHVLRKVVSKPALYEALVQLITLQNLPYNCVEWPEFQALLLMCNYTVEDVLISSHGALPRLIESSFNTHKEVLKCKLRTSLSKIHFSVGPLDLPQSTQLSCFLWALCRRGDEAAVQGFDGVRTAHQQ